MRCRVAVAYVKLSLVIIFAAAAPVVDEYSILSLPSKDSLAKLVISDGSHLQLNKPSGAPKLDCYSQRIKSLARKNDGDRLIYVPICSLKNTTLYQAVQCHDATKYCWCVQVKTGEPIPGSTTFIDKPRCLEEMPKKHGPTKRPRSKERCIGQRRTRFLRRLTTSLKTEMIMALSGNASTVNKDSAIQWKFAQLDINKNKYLERFEWKPYKATLLQWKRVRRCSRNLFKTCDLDKNKRLNPSEWKQCIAPEINRVLAKRPEQLNPFLYILKSD